MHSYLYGITYKGGGVVAISKFGGKYLLEEVSGSSPI